MVRLEVRLVSMSSVVPHLRAPVSNISHLRTPVSRPTFLQQIEVHVFYFALEYFISYPPDAADRTRCPGDRDPPGPAAASLDDHRHIAALIQQAAQKRPAERFL